MPPSPIAPTTALVSTAAATRAGAGAAASNVDKSFTRSISNSNLARARHLFATYEADLESLRSNTEYPFILRFSRQAKLLFHLAKTLHRLKQEAADASTSIQNEIHDWALQQRRSEEALEAWADEQESTLLSALYSMFPLRDDLETINTSSGCISFHSCSYNNCEYVIKFSLMRRSESIQEASITLWFRKDLHPRLILLEQALILRHSVLTVFPCAPGSNLLSYIYHCPTHARLRALDIMYELCCTIDYLHNHICIAHLDISPAHILLDSHFLPIVSHITSWRFVQYSFDDSYSHQQHLAILEAHRNWILAARQTVVEGKLATHFPKFCIRFEHFPEIAERFAHHRSITVRYGHIMSEEETNFHRNYWNLALSISAYGWDTVEDDNDESSSPVQTIVTFSDWALTTQNIDIATCASPEQLTALHESFLQFALCDLASRTDRTVSCRRYFVLKSGLPAELYSAACVDNSCLAVSLLRGRPSPGYLPPEIAAAFETAAPTLSDSKKPEKPLILDIATFTFPKLQQELFDTSQSTTQQQQSHQQQQSQQQQQTASTQQDFYNPLKVDIYALGMVFFSLLLGFTAYANPSQYDYCYKLLSRSMNRRLQQPQQGQSETTTTDQPQDEISLLIASYVDALHSKSPLYHQPQHQEEQQQEHEQNACTDDTTSLSLHSSTIPTTTLPTPSITSIQHANDPIAELLATFNHQDVISESLSALLSDMLCSDPVRRCSIKEVIARLHHIMSYEPYPEQCKYGLHAPQTSAVLAALEASPHVYMFHRERSMLFAQHEHRWSAAAAASADTASFYSTGGGSGNSGAKQPPAGTANITMLPVRPALPCQLLHPADPQAMQFRLASWSTPQNNPSCHRRNSNIKNPDLSTFPDTQNTHTADDDHHIENEHDSTATQSIFDDYCYRLPKHVLSQIPPQHAELINTDTNGTQQQHNTRNTTTENNTPQDDAQNKNDHVAGNKIPLPCTPALMLDIFRYCQYEYPELYQEYGNFYLSILGCEPSNVS